MPCYAQMYQPGFKSIGLSMENPPLRMDFAIWYPTKRQPKEITIPPWTINASLNGKPVDGKFPLLIISHATPADRYSYHNLANYLARNGFVVIAPTHGKDCMHNMDDLFTWNQLRRRMSEINGAIAYILEDNEFSGIIDAEKIGMVGFGSGATTALLLGGAIPSCSSWPDYLRDTVKDDAYATLWAKDRMNNLCADLPHERDFQNPQIRAIAAIAPGFGMLFNEESFEKFSVPLLLVAANKDKFNHPKYHFAKIARLLGKKAHLLELENADVGALIAPCPPQLQYELPEICNSVLPEERRKLHIKLAETILTFFKHYLDASTTRAKETQF